MLVKFSNIFFSFLADTECWGGEMIQFNKHNKKSPSR